MVPSAELDEEGLAHRPDSRATLDRLGDGTEAVAERSVWKDRADGQGSAGGVVEKVVGVEGLLFPVLKGAGEQVRVSEPELAVDRSTGGVDGLVELRRPALVSCQTHRAAQLEIVPGTIEYSAT